MFTAPAFVTTKRMQCVQCDLIMSPIEYPCLSWTVIPSLKRLRKDRETLATQKQWGVTSNIDSRGATDSNTDDH